MSSFREASRRQASGAPRFVIGRVAAAALAVLALQGPAAHAQLETPGGLTNIIDQLRTLQQQVPGLDTQQELGAESVPSPLDAARQGGRLDPRSGLGARTRLGMPTGFPIVPRLRPDERLLIEHFCRQTLGERERRLFVLIEEFSLLERDYCLRVRMPLFQFGYDALNAADILPELVFGAVQDSYVLGIGDDLLVTLHGRTARTMRTRVDREGRLILQGLKPISAAGRTFGETRREIEALVARAFVGTDVYVSVGNVRRTSVAVVGEVRRAGIHQLTGLSTILDALAMAGGVKKTGSLRRVHVVRGDEIFWVDLYDLLYTGGTAYDLTVFAGDRIVVPTIGATVAIGGQAKRPGIYELPEGRDSVSVPEALALAGGPLRPRGNRIFRITFDADGRQRILEGDVGDGVASDGDIVVVNRAEDVQVGSVTLVGHVRVPGRRSLASAPTLRTLLGGARNLEDDPYLLFGVLQTTDPDTLARGFFPVNLREVVDGRRNHALRDGDRLIVLGADDIRYLMSDDVQKTIQLARALQADEASGLSPAERAPEPDREGQAPTPKPSSQVQTLLSRFNIGIGPSGRETQETEEEEKGRDETARATSFPCRGLQALATVIATTRSGRFVHAVRGTGAARASLLVNPLPCPEVYDRYPELLPFVLEHVVSVDGEIRAPGIYPIAPRTSLRSLIGVTGGLTRKADLTQVEVTRFASDPPDGSTAVERRMLDLDRTGTANVMTGPGDVIRFNRVSAFADRDDGPVLLSGEFVRPGLYDIRRGERLSEVIARAGGVTPQAYPYGAVFTRERIKRAQQAGLRRVARELRAAAAYAAAKKGANAAALAAVQELIRDLTSTDPVGRMVIEADSTVLQARPELDVVLEPGDRLFMPKRPNSVLVIGDVLNPGALQFVSGNGADTYVRQAGGLQRSADRDGVFVVYPDGAAQPLSLGIWNHRPVQIPPGSTVVVPKNPAPFDVLSFSTSLAQVLSQFAITAASIAVIGDD